MPYNSLRKLISNNKRGSFFIALTFALVIIFKLISTLGPYWCGLANNFFHVLSCGLLLTPLFFILLAIFFVSLTNTVKVVFRAFKAKQLKWGDLLFSILPLLILITLLPIGSMVDSYLIGYKVWVNKNVDIPAIREWLVQVPPEYSNVGYLEEKELPEAIKGLSARIRLCDFENEKKYIKIELGNPFVDWGIMIGTEDFEMSKEEERDEIHQAESESRQLIQPGVYFYTRG